MSLIGLVYTGSDGAVTRDVLDSIARALDEQQEHLASLWGDVPAFKLESFGKPEDIPPDAWPFHVQDTLDVQGALAYHTELGGRPLLIAGWGAVRDSGGTLTSGANSLSCSCSHEFVEAWRNPSVNGWLDAPPGSAATIAAAGSLTLAVPWGAAKLKAMLDADGCEVADEIADPVQGDSYPSSLNVALSNFVGPQWSRIDGSGPFDFMGRLTMPFSMTPGGYMALRVGGPGGAEGQVFGELVPDWKKSMVRAAGRRARALARRRRRAA
ncbi:MAG TPA: hypothetical protein VMV37_01535 [Gammaproteobacteria bacterium]|nr:hypothetical protein [Gammaproteobacteria bacterium]